jgi:hypothetical protein
MAQTASETASEATENSQPRRRQRKWGKRKRPNVIGRNKVPPVRATASPKNSHTSPRRIAHKRRINEALGYREQGYTFAEIAAEMKVSISVAHNYVVAAMNAIPLENAKAVLAMELKRLDSLMRAHYLHAAAGDLAATAMVLRVMDQRAKLLGLYPEHGKTQVLIAPVTLEYLGGYREEVGRAKVGSFDAFLRGRENVLSRTREDLCYVLFSEGNNHNRETRRC